MDPHKRWIFIILGGSAAFTGYMMKTTYDEMKKNPWNKPADPTSANPIAIAHPAAIKWPHKGSFNALDMASVRRGYEVYKQVCAACHSLKYRNFRHFSDPENGFMTENEAKAEAEDNQVDDINDKGQPIKRPGKLVDRLPAPYGDPTRKKAYRKKAEAANNGKYPPDFTTIMLARRPHGFAARGNMTSNEDYIFSILTGYMDPPAGVKVDEGNAYNPYFTGGVIAMPQQLFDDGIEYKDGTPATQSQQAKDICSFLRWSAEPNHDKRKMLALKILVLMPFTAVILLYMKRHVWSFIKSQKTAWVITKGREPPKPKST